MLTYTSAELCAFDHDRPPLRSVRKSLFANHLWRPARQRWRAARPCSVTSGADVNKPTRCLSADRRSMLIGWLNVQSLSASKLDAVGELIVDRSLDVLALRETWHSSSDDARLRLTTPAGYAVVDAARPVGRGGGVAVVQRKHLKCSQIALPPCDTFEALCVRLSSSAGTVILINIYRPGSSRPSATCCDELASVLEVLVAHACPVVVGGDFNVHVHDAVPGNIRHGPTCQLANSSMRRDAGPRHDVFRPPAQRGQCRSCWYLFRPCTRHLSTAYHCRPSSHR